MSRYNRKGSVTKGGKRRAKDTTQIPAASQMFRDRHHTTSVKFGIALTRRQESKFQLGYGALHRAINHA